MIKDLVEIMDRRENLIHEHSVETGKNASLAGNEFEWYIKTIFPLDKQIVVLANDLSDSKFTHVKQVICDPKLTFMCHCYKTQKANKEKALT